MRPYEIVALGGCQEGSTIRGGKELDSVEAQVAISGRMTTAHVIKTLIGDYILKRFKKMNS
jgi:hypothetical protein